MLDAALKAIEQVLTPPFRSVLWKSLGITLIVLIAAWFGLSALLNHYVVLPYSWAETALSLLAGIGMFIGMAFLIGPVTSLVAGLFLDDIADRVEDQYYPRDPRGQPMPLGESLVISAKFAVLVLFVNIIALFLLLIPGINVVAFLGANGYLLGREYFELAGLRHMDVDEVRHLRRANRVTVFLAGVLIAAIMAIPIVNLLTPLFATAFMVHIFKKARNRAARRY
ncbi:MAG: sulfate transporter family protein [Fimbriimonadaceae bacterium]|nr:sulfate transporter family protein [Alphaproteobacteria bacterium]